MGRKFDVATTFLYLALQLSQNLELSRDMALLAGQDRAVCRSLMA